jgi:hypothetical protein
MVYAVRREFETYPECLTVYQLLREVRPVMMPLMAPRPMGRPTEEDERGKLNQYGTYQRGQGSSRHRKRLLEEETWYLWSCWFVDW